MSFTTGNCIKKAPNQVKKKENSDVSALGVEFLLATSNATFLSGSSMLTSQSTVIKNAGVTCHSSFDDRGAESTRVPEKDGGISVGINELKLKPMKY